MIHQRVSISIHKKTKNSAVQGEKLHRKIQRNLKSEFVVVPRRHADGAMDEICRHDSETIARVFNAEGT